MDKKPKKKIELTEEQRIEKLASYGLTNKEISEALGYDENTLKRNFEIFLTKGKANLKERLRRKQIQVAMQGNVTMLIWLGKQYLEQKEKVEESGELKLTVVRTISQMNEQEWAKN
ncbi:MAG: hypothetical protein IPH11_10480 [Ignavibacteriales bacterium]|nr:hypothetical protein [Ignavibacteriales bacterium]